MSFSKTSCELESYHRWHARPKISGRRFKRNVNSFGIKIYSFPTVLNSKVENVLFRRPKHEDFTTNYKNTSAKLWKDTNC